MKVSKEIDGGIVSVYQPDEKEEEEMCKVSDKIIDLMDEHNLDDDQRIHLVSSLYESMKEMYDIEGMMHDTTALNGNQHQEEKR